MSTGRIRQPSPDEIRATVLATIGSLAPDQDLAAIRAGRPLRDELALDSMDWLNFLAALQERLGVEVPAELAPRQTLDALVDQLSVRARRKEAAGPTTAGALPHTQYFVKGTWVTLRPMGPGDVELEAAFVKRLSVQTRYMRFMVTMNELPPRKLHDLTHVDQDHHVALAALAEREGRPELLGVARYIADAGGTSCEFAVAVDDAWHGCGLAGILMQALIDVARSRGLRTMEGMVLRTNTPMLKLARQLGFQTRREPDDPCTLRVVLPLQR
ncbi:GNAT family N-acetyltransferase [Ideonella sp. YS5]|uniref:GNAT family N-acetyltransferase n=1 Tax=Ideonella sp. YS5 TaxID=3453714 RepID=UPI003EEA6C69